MKRFLFVTIIPLSFNLISFAQSTSKIDSRITWLMGSFKHMRSGSFGYSNTAYNIAELFGIKGNKDSAFYFWSKALVGCPPSSPSCAEIYEPDALARVGYEKWHKTKEWRRFESTIKQSFFQINKSLKEPQLAYDLLMAKGYDQDMRGYYRYFDEHLKARSRARTKANFQFIKDVINKYGFPIVEMVGERGVKAAFLLCQHADKDLSFQKKVLHLMKNSTGTIRKEHIAYLTDRIMGAEEGLQLYGTQFKSISDRVFGWDGCRS